MRKPVFEAYLSRVDDTSDHEVLVYTSSSIVSKGWVIVCQNLSSRNHNDSDNSTIKNQNPLILTLTSGSSVQTRPNQNIKTEVHLCPKNTLIVAPTFSTTTLPFTPAFLAINFRG